ncbi:hypothetical protein [Agromyces silvae]|uniref:hypothetical protein n=1 Tax=Agromyces silvae TaxID=3388266 RepID=UPI00359FEBF4
MPEPYELLDEATAAPDASSFLRQFNASLELFADRSITGDVIFERSPLDFVAYLAALAALDRPTLPRQRFAELTERADAALRQIDLLAVIPLDRHLELHLDEEEDENLRRQMDVELLDLVEHATHAVPVVEIAGPRPARQQELSRAYLSRPNLEATRTAPDQWPFHVKR